MLVILCDAVCALLSQRMSCTQSLNKRYEADLPRLHSLVAEKDDTTRALNNALKVAQSKADGALGDLADERQEHHRTREQLEQASEEVHVLAFG